MVNDRIIETSFKIKNYKCFRDEEQGFERVFPINIIIGKNNSGKSSLIDLIQKVQKFNNNTNSIDSEDGSEVIIANKINDTFLQQAALFYVNLNSPGSNSQVWESSIRRSINASYGDFIRLRKPQNQNSIILDAHTEISQSQYREAYKGVLASIFSNHIFRRINAERDIKIEPEKSIDFTNYTFDFDGSGATNLLRSIINELIASKTHRAIVEEKLLFELNQIVNPDIVFLRIATIKINSTKWEIQLQSSESNWIPLSKMGSGIKTIILVLLNLIVIPEITNNKKKSDFIFCFEELENNLHPSLQRKLFNYIAKYCEENGCTLFITTHSNIVIDIFSKNPLAQILHVENNGITATVKTVETTKDGKNVLNDLGYKASDILLSNGVIWVEGPSDAIYLELLLELYCSEIGFDLSTLNYTIQVLSTAIWKYAGFTDFDWDKLENGSLQNQIISLAKLNHNHIVVIDNDGNYDDIEPSKWESFSNGTGQNKAKLIYESIIDAEHKESDLETNYGDTKDGKLFFWINDGTFETYLEYFIQNKGNEQFEKYFEINSKLGYLEKVRRGTNSSISKVELAAQIAMVSRDLEFSDFAIAGSSLENKIKRLVNTIKNWNSVA